MDNAILHSEAWNGICRSLESDRLAHAYVLVGSPRGPALHFAESFLKLLFCERAEKPCSQCAGCRQVDTHQHIDTFWLEPRSKARQIKADEIRALRHRMTRTAFHGTWKAGIILAADCMNPAASNVLLKTLEEPPPGTVLLLITETPQALLPTILSRCQKLVISAGRSGAEESAWHEPLVQILHELPPTGGLEATRLAGRLKQLLDEVKSGIADRVAGDLVQSGEVLDESKIKEVLEARTSALLREVYAEVFRTMTEWCRDVLIMVSGIESGNLCFPQDIDVLQRQAKLHTPSSAWRAVQQVEAMAHRLERNIPDLQVFDEAFRGIIAGQGVF